MPGLATPKRPRAVAASTSSVQEVLQQHGAKRQAVVATRVAAAESGDLTVKSLQALLDTLMDKYHPTLPRVIVTQKPFAVLRRRVNEARLPLREFLEFTLREWSAMASQNRVAMLRNPDKAKRGSPLPEAPSFAALAYRLPYFVAAFSNNRSRGVAKAGDDARDAEIASLRHRLEHAERERKVAVDLVRRRKRSEATRVEAAASLQDDDWAPPPWEK